MKSVVRLLFVACWLLCVLAPSRARADYERVVGVALRPGVAANVHVSVRENTRYRGHCVGPTVAFIHGLAHSAATWTPLVDEIFAGGLHGYACQALLVDLPGHGASPVPTGISFGELLVDDYVTAVLGTLDGLRSSGVRPQALIGHSMGGLIVESMQARLLAGGSSLAQRYGIYFAALLSPSAAAEHPWQFSDSGAAAATLGNFVTVDPSKGLVARIDAATWSFLFFTNFADQFSPGTPTPAQIGARGWSSDEAAFAGSQVVGAAPFTRPSVGVRPFDPRRGTFILYVNPSQDKFNLRSEAEAAYVQLTGDTRKLGFVRLDDELAVHDMHVAEPRRYLNLALRGWLAGL